MATIKVKRSAVPGKVPILTDLALGELGINTYDGKMYIQKDNGATQTIIEVGAHLTQGFMSIASYDSNADGKVDAAVQADEVPWSGITSKPLTFEPSTHSHLASDVTTDATYQFSTAAQKVEWSSKQNALDATVDIIIKGATVNGDIVPEGTGSRNLGSISLHFNEAWIDTLHVGSIPSMLVADILIDATTTQVDITDLDGNLHGGYFFEVLSTVSTGYLQCFVNNELTGTDYYCNILDAYSATVTNTMANNAYCGQLQNGNIQGSIYKDGFDKFRVSSQQNGDYQNSNLAIFSMHKVATITNITSLSFRGVASSKILAGTRIRLYRRK